MSLLPHSEWGRICGVGVWLQMMLWLFDGASRGVAQVYALTVYEPCKKVREIQLCHRLCSTVSKKHLRVFSNRNLQGVCNA